MKYLLVCLLALAPFAAFADDCNNPDAVKAAQTALLNIYGGGGDTNLADVQLSNISANSIGDTPVCVGEVTTSSFKTVAVWAVAQNPMGWDATVLQAVDPQHYVQSQAYIQQQQEQQEQENEKLQQFRIQQQQNQAEENNPVNIMGNTVGHVLGNLFKTPN